MRIIAAAFVASIVAAPVLSADKWVIDKGHASITFQADHLGFSVVNGRFHDFDADILFDPDDLSATQLTVTIASESVDTGWPDRDRHIRSKDFLNAETYPTITFVSTSIEVTGDDTASITGDLTMIGQTHPVTFDAKLNRLGPSPFNPDLMVAGFRAEGVIERAIWGMTFGASAFGGVAPVRIDLEISPAR